MEKSSSYNNNDMINKNLEEYEDTVRDYVYNLLKDKYGYTDDMHSISMECFKRKHEIITENEEDGDTCHTNKKYKTIDTRGEPYIDHIVNEYIKENREEINICMDEHRRMKNIESFLKRHDEEIKELSKYNKDLNKQQLNILRSQKLDLKQLINCLRKSIRSLKEIERNIDMPLWNCNSNLQIQTNDIIKKYKLQYMRYIKSIISIKKEYRRLKYEKEFRYSMSYKSDKEYIHISDIFKYIFHRYTLILCSQVDLHVDIIRYIFIILINTVIRDINVITVHDIDEILCALMLPYNNKNDDSVRLYENEIDTSSKITYYEEVFKEGLSDSYIKQEDIKEIDSSIFINNEYNKDTIMHCGYLKTYDDHRICNEPYTSDGISSDYSSSSGSSLPDDYSFYEDHD